MMYCTLQYPFKNVCYIVLTYSFTVQFFVAVKKLVDRFGFLYIMVYMTKASRNIRGAFSIS